MLIVQDLMLIVQDFMLIVQDYLDNEGTEEDYRILMKSALVNVKLEPGAEQEPGVQEQEPGVQEQEPGVQEQEGEKGKKKGVKEEVKEAQDEMKVEDLVLSEAKGDLGALGGTGAPKGGPGASKGGLGAPTGGPGEGGWGCKPVSSSPWDTTGVKVDQFAQNILEQVIHSSTFCYFFIRLSRFFFFKFLSCSRFSL